MEPAQHLGEESVDSQEACSSLCWVRWRCTTAMQLCCSAALANVRSSPCSSWRQGGWCRRTGSSPRSGATIHPTAPVILSIPISRICGECSAETASCGAMVATAWTRRTATPSTRLSAKQALNGRGAWSGRNRLAQSTSLSPRSRVARPTVRGFRGSSDGQP